MVVEFRTVIDGDMLHIMPYALNSVTNEFEARPDAKPIQIDLAATAQGFGASSDVCTFPETSLPASSYTGDSFQAKINTGSGKDAAEGAFVTALHRVFQKSVQNSCDSNGDQGFCSLVRNDAGEIFDPVSVCATCEVAEFDSGVRFQADAAVTTACANGGRWAVVKKCGGRLFIAYIWGSEVLEFKGKCDRVGFDRAVCSAAWNSGILFFVDYDPETNEVSCLGYGEKEIQCKWFQFKNTDPNAPATHRNCWASMLGGEASCPVWNLDTFEEYDPPLCPKCTHPRYGDFDYEGPASGPGNYDDCQKIWEQINEGGLQNTITVNGNTYDFYAGESFEGKCAVCADGEGTPEQGCKCTSGGVTTECPVGECCFTQENAEPTCGYHKTEHGDLGCLCRDLDEGDGGGGGAPPAF
jgi:hypothetical protein